MPRIFLGNDFFLITLMSGITTWFKQKVTIWFLVIYANREFTIYMVPSKTSRKSSLLMLPVMEFQKTFFFFLKCGNVEAQKNAIYFYIKLALL